MKYYLLDRITSIEIGAQATGQKCVTLTDEILHDHFPGFPVLPGALIIEGLAQLTGFLLEATFNKMDETRTRRGVLAQVDKMKFYKMTAPGDRLNYSVKIDSILDEAAQVSVEAKCDDEIRAKGKITFAMIDIDSPEIHKQRMGVYKIWTRELENCPPFR